MDYSLTVELPHGSILTHKAVCVIISPVSLEITLWNFVTFSRIVSYTSTENYKNVAVILLEILENDPYMKSMWFKIICKVIEIILTDTAYHNRKCYMTGCYMTSFLFMFTQISDYNFNLFVPKNNYLTIISQNRIGLGWICWAHEALQVKNQNAQWAVFLMSPTMNSS